MTADPRFGYTALSVKRDLLPDLQRFQVLAISKSGRMLTKTETLRLALELATKALQES